MSVGSDKWPRNVSTGAVDDDLPRFLRNRSAEQLLLVPPDGNDTTKTAVIAATAMQTGSNWCRPEIRRHRNYNVLVRSLTVIIIVSGHRHGGCRCNWSQGGQMRRTRNADSTTDQADISILLRSSVVRACGLKNIIIKSKCL